MGVKRAISRLFLKMKGWKVDPNVPEEAKGNCVLIAAPHTSNWDFPLAVSAMELLGINIRFTIKREWMRPPAGWFFKSMGGIGVDRRPKIKGETRKSMVDTIAGLFEGQKGLCIILEPEGTRSLVKDWKTGFYYIALKANVPIVLGWLDYEKKIAGIGNVVIHPSGDIDKDMAKIMCFYKDIKGKFPENFALDTKYYKEGDCDEEESK